MSQGDRVTLTEEQHELLKHDSKRTGAGLAELVRRAIASVYGSGRRESVEGDLEASFGA